jgi:hypothetical protein
MLMLYCWGRCCVRGCDDLWSIELVLDSQGTSWPPTSTFTQNQNDNKQHNTITTQQTEAPPSIPGDKRGRLLRRKKGNSGADQPSIPAASLSARPKIQFGYVAVMKLPGGQVCIYTRACSVARIERAPSPPPPLLDHRI